MENKISIIIPAFNMERYLHRCLESIRQQSYSNLEIIVADDGSTDKTIKVAKKAAENDDRIIILALEHKGQARARCAGIENASGDWIGFADADDEIEPDMYERLLDNALRYKKSISHCGMKMVSLDGRIRYIGKTGETIIQSHDDALTDLIRERGSIASLCNKLFHRDLFHNVERHAYYQKRDFQYGEDLLLDYLLFSAADGAVYEGWCPYRYYGREDSLIGRKIGSQRIYDPIHIRDLIRKDISENLYQVAQGVYLECCINTYNSLLLKGEDYCEYMKTIRNYVCEEQETLHLLGDRISVMGQLMIDNPKLYDKVICDIKNPCQTIRKKYS